MECIRCGNSDPNYFYKGHKGTYCRKCIGFSRVLLEEELYPYEYEISEGVDEYQFSYELTDKQNEASLKTAEIINRKDVLLHCVCGAGKTEITVESIANALKRGLKVAYAIARKEVVIELEKRFKSIFTSANVVGVYGGHHDTLHGDLIICTCHQLFRYYKTFDLLILDEADAFPLKGNDVLMQICLSSCKGHIIFSTATVNEQLMAVLRKRGYEKVMLNTRPSKRPLSIPDIYYLDRYSCLFMLNHLFRKIDGQIIVFVSRRKMARDLGKLFKRKYDSRFVYSDLENRKEVIESFRNKEFRILFSTTVLERGVTIKGVSVILLCFDRSFDEGNIIQMLGRVGRGIEDDKGRSIIIANHYEKMFSKIINYLKEANSYL